MRTAFVGVLVALAALCCCFPMSAAWCGVGPYNLTALEGTDLLVTLYGTSWAIRPCGTVTTSGFCTNGGPGQFCQGDNTVSVWNSSATGNALTDYSAYGTDNDPLWAAITLQSGQMGVAQILQDGLGCGGYGSRQGTIEFLCNPSATTAYISSILETVTCHYQAQVQTDLVCGVTAAEVQAAGLPVISTQCGGGIFDLSGGDLTTTDLLYNSSDDVGYAVRVCGGVSTISPCSGQNPPWSVCLYNPANFSLPSSDVASYFPYGFPVIYQYQGPGTVSQIIQDGWTCPTSNFGNTERLVNITLSCDASATTPRIVSLVESPPCHFQILVATTATCGQTPYSVVPATTSTTCGFGPFDLSSISNYTLFTHANDNWAVRPCGLVTDVGYCPGQVCQNTNIVNVYEVNQPQTPNNYQAGTGSYSVPLWAAVTFEGQFGVMQTLQTGASCGNVVGARQANLYFLCNDTATVPYISSVLPESPSCHYGLVVQTNAVCNVQPAQTETVGIPVATWECGGGIYDLSALTEDITGSFGGNNYTINLCSNITTPSAIASCGNNPFEWSNYYLYYSVCQAWNGGGEGLGSYPTLGQPGSRLQVYWTYTGNGLQELIQDGFADCGGTTEERTTNVTLVCNSAATTPELVSEYESPECHYNFVIETDAVCGAPLFTGPPASSSSAVAAPSSSVSVSASSAVSSLPLASSSAASAASSSAAVSSSALAMSSSAPLASSSSAPAVLSSSSAALSSSAPLVLSSSSAAQSSSAPLVLSSSSAALSSSAPVVLSSSSAAMSSSGPLVPSSSSAGPSSSPAQLSSSVPQSSASATPPSASSSSAPASSLPVVLSSSSTGQKGPAGSGAVSAASALPAAVLIAVAIVASVVMQ